MVTLDIHTNFSDSKSSTTLSVRTSLCNSMYVCLSQSQDILVNDLSIIRCPIDLIFDDIQSDRVKYLDVMKFMYIVCLDLQSPNTVDMFV